MLKLIVSISMDILSKNDGLLTNIDVKELLKEKLDKETASSKESSWVSREVSASLDND